MDDLDDLLGPSPKPRLTLTLKPEGKRGPDAPPAPGKRRRGRPTKAETAAHAAKEAKKLAAAEPDSTLTGIGDTAMPDVTAFHRPVTRTFLATMLGKEPRRLVKQLAKCPVIGYGNPGRGGEQTPLYDFKEAIRYCVDPPAGQIEQWIKSQSSTTLPPLISKAFWEAQATKQRVEERSGDLWRTADVLDVLGRTALNIKDTAQLWIEGLPGKATLTTEQYESLRREVAGLLDDIHQRLVQMPSECQTRPLTAEIEAMVDEATFAESEEE